MSRLTTCDRMLISGLKHFSIEIRPLLPRRHSTKMPSHSLIPELWPAGLRDSSKSLLIRRETCTIISVCLSFLDHRRGSQIWFMICCLMARALALRGDQMTFSTGACQGRNGECTITTGWQRKWERTPVLRLNGGEMLLKSDGKMIPVNTAKGGGDGVQIWMTWCWKISDGKGSKRLIVFSEDIQKQWRSPKWSLFILCFLVWPA